MNEHCGQYQIQRGKRVKGDIYLLEAFQLYRKYGALGKCQQLKDTYGLFGDCTPIVRTNLPAKKKWDSDKSIANVTVLTRESSLTRGSSAESATSSSLSVFVKPLGFR